MNLNDINEWRSPEEAERPAGHNWRGRLAMATVCGPVFGVVGALVFRDAGVFVPLAGIVAVIVLLF